MENGKFEVQLVNNKVFNSKGEAIEYATKMAEKYPDLPFSGRIVYIMPNAPANVKFEQPIEMVERPLSKSLKDEVSAFFFLNEQKGNITDSNTYRYRYGNEVPFSELLGKTLTKVIVGKDRDDEIKFYCNDGSSYLMHHEQDCCESVDIEDICGDLDRLLNSPILLAEEVSNTDENAPESATWTFYKLSTVNDSVTIRWYGSSNGYYSESVQFKRMK